MPDQKPTLQLKAWCEIHPKYRGAKRPLDCPTCEFIYNSLHPENSDPAYIDNVRYDIEESSPRIQTTFKNLRISLIPA